MTEESKERMISEKQKLRKIYLKRTSAGDPDLSGNAGPDREDLSRRITARLLVLKEWQDAESVFCYVGTDRELDTAGILEAALQEGKRLAVPKINGKGIMTAREIFSLKELSPGHMGILEPSDTAPVLAGEELSLVIVPGLAFDPEGFRLGYGGGYYDRYLKGLSACTIGLCREACLCSRLPRESHDIHVRMVLTEARTLCIGS